MLSDAIKIGIGISQASKARKLGNAKRPAYQVPDSLKQLLNATKFESSVSGLPGQGQMENKLAQSSAGTMNAVLRSQQSPAAMLAGLTAVDQNYKSAVSDLGVQGAQYRDQKQGQYYDALGMMAEEEKAAWEWDQKNPYLNAMAASSALKNASMSNIMTGIEGIEGQAQQAAMMLAGMPPMGGKQGQPMATGQGQATGQAAQYGGYNPAMGGYGGLQSPQGGWGGASGRQGGFMGGSPDDDWLMYGERMQQLFPKVSEETLKEQLPMFKQNYLMAVNERGLNTNWALR